ncbi:unnamed protein product [Sphagnum troendelagicum]|uniref:Pentatricopeptide repeat-containing protein n=1 Tax=Sphagnum troendelagicum TaxID=128251 RepID=A0ABP0U235_9BRYO
MYAKLGSIEDINIAMILGHVQCGQGQKALQLFRQMQQEGVQPNFITFLGVLKACASIVALEEGRCVHQRIIQSGLESNVFLRSALVDMYAKCGRIEDACRVFNKMPFQNVVTWTAMPLKRAGCVHQQIIQTGLKSNVFVGITLMDMYAKCGSIEDAWGLFNNMPY